MTTEKRMALVTGGNRGIGPEICRQLALTGTEVMLGARNPDKANEAVIPIMRREGYGRIVNLVSELGSLTNMETLYPAYRMSKTALIAYTRVLANELTDTGILVNSMCPGWVKTEMGGPNAIREVEDSADTAIWLATLPDDGPTGGFFKDRKPLPW